MEYGLLFKKTSTCYKNPDIEYLDETSDYKLQILLKLGKITEEEFHQKHAELERSISYLTKEKHGRVYAGGFIRDALLSKKGLAPEKWDNETRKKAISSVVQKISRQYGTYRKTMGHKMIFSVSDELAQKVEGSGLNLDDILGREVKKIMYEFQHKFHPGEKLGFAWGVHHDTDHRHVHVYLCNRTNKGTHVALSTPLKGKRDKAPRKDQIGYMKERCLAAQKRMLKQAEKMNYNELPKKVSEIKIEQNPAHDLSKRFLKENEELEQARRSLIEKENLLKLQQEKIRQFYSDYYLRQSLVSQGWSDLKQLNLHISENYQDLKKNDTVIPQNLLRELGYITNSGAIKQASKILAQLQRIAEQARREKLLNKIELSKAQRTEFLNQLKLLDWQNNIFRKRVKSMKSERENLRKEFYQERYRHEQKRLKFNYDFFKEFVTDRGKRSEYYQAGRSLWQKRKQKLDSSIELAIIRKLDEEAREIALCRKRETESMEAKAQEGIGKIKQEQSQSSAKGRKL